MQGVEYKMKRMKKIMVSTLVLLAIGSSGVYSYANNSTAKTEGLAGKEAQEVKIENEETLEIVTPNKEVVPDTDLLVIFKAPEGTTVILSVYYNTSVATNKQNYVEAYDPIEVVLGPLQKGWAEIKLKKGLNKINFVATYKDGNQDVINRIIEVKNMDEIDEQVTKGIGSASSTKVLKTIVNTDSK